MSELIRKPEVAEKQLEGIIERFRSTPLANQEVYSTYGLEDGDTLGIDERQKQKDLFISGEIRNPKFSYPVLERLSGQLDEEEKIILDLMAESTSLAHDQDREAAVYDLLRIHYLEIYIMKLSREISRDELSEEERAEKVRLYNLANDEVHGKLDPEWYAGLVRPTKKIAEEVLQDKTAPESIREIAEYMVDNIGTISEDYYTKEPIKIPKDKMEAAGRLVREIYADLIACVPKKDGDEKLSVDELAQMFEAAHSVRNTGWHTRLEAGKDNVDTRQNEKVTVIGTERKLSDSMDAVLLLLEENGVHVARRQGGDNSGDTLLNGMGLAGNLASEEGLASVIKEAFKGKQSEPRRQYYLVASWARGLDGRAPRDFRDVYELDWRRRVLQSYKKKGEPEEAKTLKFKSDAYKACVRVFRGTAFDIPGMVYTKDQLYFMGNQKMWPVMEEIVSLPSEQQVEVFNRLLTAKFDPTRPLDNRLVDKVLERKGER